MEQINQISLCIPTYNRTALLYESFAHVADHPLIGEILIVDDASREDVRNEMFQKLFAVPKVRLVFNTTNRGCYHNKAHAIRQSQNEWVILFDSDNILPKSYVDRVETILIGGASRNTVYQPDFASPHFNFQEFSGQTFDRANVAQYARNATFTTALNAMNYFVHRDEYLRVWENRSEPWTADSLLQNYNWLNAGNQIYFVPGMQYEHRIHEGSHYREHHRKTIIMDELLQGLKEMR